MDREQHARLSALADDVKRSRTLPSELTQVLATGLEVHRPEPSAYGRMTEPEPQPSWWREIGLSGPGAIRDDDRRP